MINLSKKKFSPVTKGESYRLYFVFDGVKK